MPDLILLGYVARAFGIEGGVVIRLFNEASHSLEVGKQILLKGPMVRERVVTISALINGGRVFFKDIDDRTQAEALKGAEVWLHRADFPPLTDDEFYLTDLMHARVLDMSGDLLGEVVGFSSNGAQILIEIKTTAGHVALIPAVRPIINRIDFNEKIIIVDPPVGLLDPME
jgi:16S rRNA processing protein RimM